ncbi:hypothetical protein LXL04_009416 [Taraxacum kok-saghyz]
MNRNEPAIGIDLGTTYTCVAVWKYDRIEIIPNNQGNRTTPSCVVFVDAARLIGDGAKNQAAINPTNTIFDAKRLIGRKFSDSKVQDDMKLWPFKVIEGPADTPKIAVSYQGEEKEFLAEEISFMILGKMKEISEAYMGKPVKNAVITVPAYFTDSQCQATKDAGTIAGPKVRSMLQNLFNGKELYKSLNPDEAVAILAEKLSGDHENDKRCRDLVLLDVTPLSLGVQSKGEVLTVVVPRNTPIPTKKFKRCYTFKSSINIMVYQGERAKSTNNHLAGEFTLSGIPANEESRAWLNVCFEIDASGILTVTAEIEETGEMEKLTITNEHRRLSKEEIKKMVNDAEKYKREDQEYKEKVSAFNYLDYWIYRMKIMIRNMASGNKLKKIFRYWKTKKKVKKMKHVIADTTKWIERNQAASIDQVLAMKEYLESMQQF